MKRTSIVTALLACALLACGQDPPPPVEAEPERAPAPIAPATPAAAPAPVAEAEPTAEEVPVPEDFEDEAEKDIKPTSLRAELDALEHEIASDAP